MKETKLPREMLEVISSNTGLSLYLDGLLRGKPPTQRSSLYNIEGKTKMLEPDAILGSWMQYLDELAFGSKFEKEVYQFDSHQLEKWGPQGGVAPINELLKPIVSPSFEQRKRPAAFSSALWREAKRIVSQELKRLGCRGLQPVPYKRVVDDMRVRDTLESNSGWPLFAKRSLPEVVRQSIDAAEDGRWKTYPAIALFRNYNNKTRLVWMFPMSANIVEGSYFQVLQSILMNSAAANKFLAPWNGFETVRELITEAYANDYCVAASDFSSTDAHFKLDTTLEVYDVIAPCFQPQYRAGLKESLIHMHRIPLVIGPDHWIVGDHGVSSGSNWTNFVETIFDWILSVYVALVEAGASAGKFLSFEKLPSDVYNGLYAIGDDMSWKVKKSSYDADFSKRLETYGKSVGQEIKADKTTNDRDKVKSLQRLFQAGYFRQDHMLRAVYPTIRALKSLVYPERMHKKALWSKDMSAVRAFMILENCVDHPLFESFCKFVVSGDPYLPIFARSGSAHMQEALRKSKLVPGLNTTYNQERRDSRLSEFSAIKFVATL